jgi:hypothetical protein
MARLINSYWRNGKPVKSHSRNTTKGRKKGGSYMSSTNKKK